MKKTFLDKLWENSHTVPETGCVLWDGRTSPSGHGTIYVQGFGVRPAHVAMWLLYYGWVPPKGHDLHHVICENPACINPLHLILMPRAEHNELPNSDWLNRPSWGTYREKDTGRYRAMFRYKKQPYSQGTYATEDEAHAASVTKRLELMAAE